jgi:rubrerythrin
MTTQGIDFETLSLRDALDLAVLIEEEARERYLEFAHQMDIHRNPEAASFFRFMAENEAKHGATLHERRTELFGSQPVAVTRSMLFDVEAPEYDEARSSMSVRQAMQAAMRSEVKAREFFAGALAQVRQADVRKLFESLRDEELEHEQLVKERLDALPPDSDMDPDAFADEPVAH